ncbi:MAG: DUF4142 domain-containing protein [Planctomycetaceae bacterium]|nr:DUF4142 domain-containing protein [Planctomycetaceae bacterium]
MNAHLCLVAFVVVLPIVCRSAEAQNPAAARAVAPAAAGRLDFGSDYQLASWLVVDQQLEIAAAKIAVEKAVDQRVRTLAQQLLDDHTALLAAFEAFAPQQPEPRAAQIPPPSASKTDAPQGVAEPPVVAADAGPAFDLVSLKRSLGRRTMETRQRELSALSGSDFERHWLRMELVAHQEAADTLKVFREKASPALQAALDRAIPTVQGHLTALEQALSFDAGR